MPIELSLSDSRASTQVPAQAGSSTIVVIAVALGATAIVGPTLAALTHGWDYRLAVLFGALIAGVCLSVGRRCLPEDDTAGRLGLECEAGFAAVLFCVYASDWLDWRPFGLDDAFVGLAVGLALLAAGPARRALRHVAVAPHQASLTLLLLAVAPAGAALVVLVYMNAGDRAVDAAFLLAVFASSLALAWLGAVFAVRRGFYDTACLLSALSGLALFGLLAAGGAPWTSAGFLGALAGAWPLLLVCYLWYRAPRRADTPPGDRLVSHQTPRRTDTPAEDLLVSLVITSILWCLAGQQVVAGVALAGAVATWWLRYYRPDRPLFARSGSPEGEAVRAALQATRYGVGGVLFGAYGLLFTAAALNLTGPMVLAAIGATGVYRVSDLTFSETLLADQYLWRDAPASARIVGAASPERWVRLMRTEHDRWSTAVHVAYVQAREERRPEGLGLEIDEDPAGGFRVVYAYPGSPGRAAGIRRGDVIATLDGTAVPAPGANRGARSGVGHQVRLGLERPDAGPREVTVAKARYARPSVTIEKVIPFAGRRVGYILLHDFDRHAAAEFVYAAARLREQGMEDLVLDLRMNPGGSLAVSRDIASAIGGSRLDGVTFQRIEHNERYRDRDENIEFRVPEWGVLALPRLFVIMSEDTCSASEALINGLAPHMSVVTVGTTTCGKPVGMTVVDYGDRSYWVITFRVLNSRGEGDYFAGLRPICPAENDFGHELGDPEEASLKAALEYLRDGRCATRARAEKPQRVGSGA